MYLLEKFKKKYPVISFEIFPPNAHMSLKKLIDVIDELAIYRPDYISVTYGASGNSNNNYTIDIAGYIKEKFSIEAMPHMTCVSASKEQVYDLAEQLMKKDIKNLLALRGDLPKDLSQKSNDFSYASDLISFIKTLPFPVATSAACYPEGHMESPSIDIDIQHLKYKVSQGVDFLITQLFFDNQKFYSFKEKLVQQRIDPPISIGIMPITNAKQIKRILALSGASVPTTLKRTLDKYETDPSSMFEAGIEFACNQIEELSSFGVDGYHLYVMNKPEVAKKI